VFAERTNLGAIALFVGAFAKLRKATISFLKSARPTNTLPAGIVLKKFVI
jgi:hypothetical protein